MSRWLYSCWGNITQICNNHNMCISHSPTAHVGVHTSTFADSAAPAGPPKHSPCILETQQVQKRLQPPEPHYRATPLFTALGSYRPTIRQACSSCCTCWSSRPKDSQVDMDNQVQEELQHLPRNQQPRSPPPRKGVGLASIEIDGDLSNKDTLIGANPTPKDRCVCTGPPNRAG